LRDQLVARCTPLADNIARRFNGRGEPLDDLTQVARVGLMNAIDRFDAERGSSFLSFAVPTIMGEVRRHFRDNTWAMRVPRRVKETHLRIGGAIDALSQRLGRSPTAREIAAELDVDRAEVTQALIAANAYQPTSIDAAMASGESESTLLDTLGEPEPRYERIEEYLAIGPLVAALHLVENPYPASGAVRGLGHVRNSLPETVRRFRARRIRSPLAPGGCAPRSPAAKTSAVPYPTARAAAATTQP
jgi:RNA polymerase sigma-B factor